MQCVRILFIIFGFRVAVAERKMSGFRWQFSSVVSIPHPDSARVVRRLSCDTANLFTKEPMSEE